MNKSIFLAAAAAITLSASPVMAQTTTNQSSRDRIGNLLGTLFGGQVGTSGSIEAQWIAGRTPLTNQRTQFDSRVDAEVRAGSLNQASGQRLKSEYYDLAQLEGRYGADGRFSQQERAELTAQYNALTEALSNGGYADTGTAATADVANGRIEFERRVDAQVGARRITRAQGTRLKTDYAAAIQVETGYLRDGVLSASERDDLDERLDTLDSRVGDTGYAQTAATPRTRLTAIGSALPSSGLSATAQAQLRVEVEDVSRLEAAYSRLTVTADERAYLERRLSDLEGRARVRR